MFVVLRSCTGLEIFLTLIDFLLNRMLADLGGDGRLGTSLLLLASIKAESVRLRRKVNARAMDDIFAAAVESIFRGDDDSAI
jgi:hypothetical protein